jgi:mannosyl-3-phosphoglycerate phosphatase
MGFFIVTDLDGTLLDHDYSWDGARSALAEIDRLRIPLILTTSKTRAELLPLRKKLKNNWPFITENGGAVFFPRDTWPYTVPDTVTRESFQILIIGRPYQFIRTVFAKLQKDFPIRGFADMQVGEIAALTGLDHEEAVMARQREFSEPFLLDQPELLTPLANAAAEHDCTVVKGGRFCHLMAREQDKGIAVAKLIEQYRAHFGECTTIGLGDSGNDLSMLNRVDIPVLIVKPDGSYEDYKDARLIRSRNPGSRGWAECILEIIGHGPAQHGH